MTPLLLTLSLLFPSCLSLPLPTQDTSTSIAYSYLSKFGYIPSSSVQTQALISLDSAIADFQAFAGLEVTGKLDSETLELMGKPRCGVKDFLVEDKGMWSSGSNQIDILPTRRRTKRYALQGSRWKVKDLTYRISKYPIKSGLTHQQVDDVIRKAFQVWEKATDLKFTTKSSGKVHIEIRFESGAHGDDDPFDGEGGTLAHAFFPVYGGDAHFDDDEDWTVNTYRGTSLLMTAAHELGHSLGLSHSNVRSSLMAPFYRGYDPNLSLEEDDIRGIHALYGAKSTSKQDTSTKSVKKSTSTTETPSPHSVQTRTSVHNLPELCESRKLDTIVTLEDEETYAFLGDQYWKLTETSVADGYPRSISKDWDGLPGDLDASFTWVNGKTYFFKGSKYWRFSANGSMDSNYPKKLSKGFSGIPDNVDAAFVWPVNDKIYFFKDTMYWKFDPKSDPPVEDSYPRPIANWDGIPNSLDAVLQYSNGRSYFFKDGSYYRFDDKKEIVDDNADPPFPRQTGFWWFGCPAANSVRLSLPQELLVLD